MRLERQKVLITGGTAGIGRAVAVALLRRGNEVMVCARGEDGLRRIREEQPSIRAVRADIGCVDDLRGLPKLVEDRNKVRGSMRHADLFGVIVQDGMA